MQMTIINPAGLYDPVPNGYSHAVVAEGARIAFIAGQGGEDRTVALAAGQAAWSTGPVIHAAQANHAVELIVIELK